MLIDPNVFITMGLTMNFLVFVFLAFTFSGTWAIRPPTKLIKTLTQKDTNLNESNLTSEIKKHEVQHALASVIQNKEPTESSLAELLAYRGASL